MCLSLAVPAVTPPPLSWWTLKSVCSLLEPCRLCLILFISLCSFHPTAEFCLSSVSCFLFTVFSFLLPFTRSEHRLVPQSPKHYSLKNKLLQRMGHNRCKTSSERHSRASRKVKLNHWVCQRRGHAFLDCACQLILGHFLPKDCFLRLFSPSRTFFSARKHFFFQYGLVIWVGSNFLMSYNLSAFYW